MTLIPYGHREAELREHSLAWISRLGREHRKRVRHEMADQLTLAALAATAPHSEEAGGQVQEVIEELRLDQVDDVSHITDKDAQTDMAALAPFLVRQPRSQEDTEPHGR